MTTQQILETPATATVLTPPHSPLSAGPTAPKTRRRLSAFIDEFVRDKTVSAATRAARASHARNWVTPHWQEHFPDKITPADIASWYDDMAKNGAGETTIEKASRILTGAFTLAIRHGEIHTNPAPKAPTPTRNTTARPRLTQDEVNELIAATDPRFRTLMTLLTHTDITFSEAIALRAGAIDTDRRRIHVREALTEVRGKLITGAPTGGPPRDINYPDSIHADLVSALHKLEPEALVFSAAEGGPIRVNTWRRRYLNAAFDFINELRVSLGQPAFPRVKLTDLRPNSSAFN